MSALLPIKIETAASHTVFDVMQAASVTWTDISDFVLYNQGVSFNRGRPAESTTTTPGTLTFTVKTKHDGSTVDLPLRRPVRVSWYAADDYDALAELYDTYDDYAAAVAAYEDADGTGAWYVLWTGSISEVRHGWQAGVRGAQQVTATDNISVAERTVLDAWPVALALDFGDVSWTYPLDDRDSEAPPREASGATPAPQFAVRPVGVPPEGSGVALGSGRGPAEDGSAASFDGADANGGWCLEAFDALGLHPNPGIASATVSVYVYLPTLTYRDMVVLSLSQAHYAQDLRLDLGVAAGGFAYAGWTLPGGSTTGINGTDGVGSGAWHHIALTIEVSGGGTLFETELWLDGVSQGTASASNGPYSVGRYQIRIGAGINDVAPLTGLVAAPTLFADVLTDDEIADLAGVVTGYSNEQTVARFHRLGRLADFTTSTASSGIGTMGAQPLAGKTVAAAMNDCSVVEHAPWYTTTDGVLTLVSRASLWNNAEIVTGSPDYIDFSFGIVLPAEAISPSTAISLDDKTLANVVTGNRPGGLTYTATSTSSVASYGSYAKATTYLCGSDAEMTTYVDADLADNDTPALFSETLTVDVVAAAASIQIGDVLGAEIGDIIRLTDVPTDSPLGTEPRFRVVGMADRLSPRGWQRTFNTEYLGAVTDLISAVAATSGSPVAWVWILDDSDYPLGARTGTTFDTRLGL